MLDRSVWLVGESNEPNHHYLAHKFYRNYNRWRQIQAENGGLTDNKCVSTSNRVALNHMDRWASPAEGNGKRRKRCLIMDSWYRTTLGSGLWIWKRSFLASLHRTGYTVHIEEDRLIGRLYAPQLQVDRPVMNGLRATE